MSTQNSVIDELMGFDPQNLSAFQDKGPHVDPNIYKTNPKDSKAEDGIYRSRVKILLNPWAPKDSIAPQTTYWLQSLDGSRAIRSKLANGDKTCPLFVGWKRLWFSGDDQKKEFAKQVYQKNESQWVAVQILEDENKPELVGQFRVMKLAKDIYDKLVAKMNPSASSKNAPYPVMDYVIGLELNIEVQPGPDDPKAPERKQREISYSLSNFGQYATIIKTDGTPLLTEEETELVDQYATAINDMQNGKTEKKRKDGAAKIEEIKPQIRPIYAKCIEYVKENLVDQNNGQPLNVMNYCGYSEWDDNTKDFVEKWIEMVDDCVNPANMSYETWKKQKAAPVAPAPVAQVPENDLKAPASAPDLTPAPAPANPAEDDLPF